MKHKIFNASIVGLGNQNLGDHIPALLRRSDIKVIGACDNNKNARKRFTDQYPKLMNKITLYENFDQMPLDSSDFLIVSLPHNQYLKIVKKLVTLKKHFMKEKPFARSSHEMLEMLSLKDLKKYCFICTQRKYSSIFQEAFKNIKRGGRPFLFEVIYKLKITRPNEGWRGNISQAGGG